MDRMRALVSPEVWAFLADRNAQIAIGATFLVLVLGCCRIFARAGRHAALGLLMLVPGLNLAMFLYLAFGPWPTQQELRVLRRAQRASLRAERAVRRIAA